MTAKRQDYAEALIAADATTLPGYSSLYTPLYFARHYILLNMGIPWYEKDAAFNLNLIGSPDSASLFFHSLGGVQSGCRRQPDGRTPLQCPDLLG